MRENNGSVLVVIMCGRNILLVREPGRRLPTYWKLPGGEIEDGETPEQAAIREIDEEIGIDLSTQKTVLLSETPQVGRSGSYIQHLFGCEVPYHAITNHDGKVVVRYDKEGEMLESTCFDIGEVERMVDFMPKHFNMLRAMHKQPA